MEPVTSPDMPGLEGAIGEALATKVHITDLPTKWVVDVILDAAHPIIERAVREKIERDFIDWMAFPPDDESMEASAVYSTSAAWPIQRLIRGTATEGERDE
jgi:hypothetical protein